MDSSTLSKHRQRIKRIVELGYTVDPQTGNVFKPDGSLQETHIHTGTKRSEYLVFSASAKPLSGLVYVHSLVSYLIYGDAALEKDIEARHKNGNRTDNTKDNILIGTSAENKHDIPLEIRREFAARTMATTKQRRAAKGRTRFTDDEIRSIRWESDHGAKVSKLVRTYNVDRATIYDIKKRKSYRNVPEAAPDQYSVMYSA